MLVPFACSSCDSPAASMTRSQAATYFDRETPTPSGTMQRSAMTFIAAVYSKDPGHLPLLALTPGEPVLCQNSALLK